MVATISRASKEHHGASELSPHHMSHLDLIDVAQSLLTLINVPHHISLQRPSAYSLHPSKIIPTQHEQGVHIAMTDTDSRCQASHRPGKCGMRRPSAAEVETVLRLGQAQSFIRRH